jgi:hypothetical protein
VFLVDDALSMTAHWIHLVAVFEILAYLVKSADPDGIDLLFTMSSEKHNSRKRFPFGKNASSRLTKVVHDKRGHLQGVCDMSWKLRDILDPYNNSLRNQHHLRKTGNPQAPHKDIRPLNLYVLTDGEWSPECDADRVIKSLVGTLAELDCDPKQVGIQFISFGHNEAGLERLKHLDDDLGQEM